MSYQSYQLIQRTSWCQRQLKSLDSCAGQQAAQYITNPTGQLKGAWIDPSPVPAAIGTTSLLTNSVDDPVAAEAVKACQHFGYGVNATYGGCGQNFVKSRMTPTGTARIPREAAPSLFSFWRARDLIPFLDNGDEVVGRVQTWSIGAFVSAIAFGLLLWTVVAHSGLTLADPGVATFVASHRIGWLTPVMQLVTWLGSSFFIIPLGVAAGGSLWFRRHTWYPLVMMAAAFLGAAGLYDIAKPTVGRSRPPAALQVGGPDDGWAFPSGHATQSISFYGMLAIVLIVAYAPRRPLLLAIGAALITLVIGASRLYLGVHWLTDVLGGYALGLAWLAVVMVTTLLVEGRMGQGRKI